MKDPAILFYTSDFLSGTMFMTDEQAGKYIRLLCAQHQNGHLSEKHMLKICGSYDFDIFKKFIKDENGDYYNKRMDDEVNRRLKYSESRRNNRNGLKNSSHMNNICETHDESYVSHMENINRTITKTISLEERKKKFIDTVDSFNHGFTPAQREEFIAYWTASNPGDLKMAFEKEKNFYYMRRFLTWKKNSFGSKVEKSKVLDL